MKRSRIQNIIDKMKRPAVGQLLFGQFAAVLAMANMEANLFLFVKDRFDWNVRTASYGFAYVGLCIALTQGYLVRKLIPKMGERWVLMNGFTLFSVGLILVGLSHGVPLLGFGMTLLALGNGLISPSLSGGLSLLTSANEQGEVIGVYHSLGALARIIGPPVGGFIYMHWGMNLPFYFAGTVSLTGMFVIYGVLRQIPNSGKEK
jgi:MFS transporter, DHA1 family, tetracycline resistance protein